MQCKRSNTNPFSQTACRFVSRSYFGMRDVHVCKDASNTVRPGFSGSYRFLTGVLDQNFWCGTRKRNRLMFFVPASYDERSTAKTDSGQT